MKLPSLTTVQLSPRFAAAALTVTILAVVAVEGRMLYNLEHRKPHRVGCVQCHSDKKTLEAMADKAGDPLYLVHSGQLTLTELDRLTGKRNDPKNSAPIPVLTGQDAKCPVTGEEQSPDKAVYP